MAKVVSGNDTGSHRISRRQVLTTLSAGAVSGLAGCGSNQPPTTSPPTSPGTDTNTLHPPSETTVTTQANLPEWDASSTERPYLSEIVFATTSKQVDILLPKDITAGDRVTITVQTESENGETPFDGLELEITGSTFSLDETNPTFGVSDDAEEIKLSLIHAEQGVVAEATSSVFAEPPGYPTIPAGDITIEQMTKGLKEAGFIHEFPPILQNEYEIVHGPFDANLDKTSISVNGQDATLVAQTLRRTVFRNPKSLTGMVPATVSVYGHEEAFETRSISFGHETKQIEKGQETTVRIQVAGLGGLEKRRMARLAFLTIENKGEHVANLVDKDSHTVVVHPGVVDDQGQLSELIPVIGDQDGEVELKARLAYEPPPDKENWIKDAIQGKVSAGSRTVTIGEWPNVTNTAQPDSESSNLGVPPDSSFHRSYAVGTDGVDSALAAQQSNVPNVKQELITLMEENVYPEKTDALTRDSARLANSLKAHFKEYAENEAKYDYSENEFKEAFKEAEQLAHCIIRRIYFERYVSGWNGSHSANIKGILFTRTAGICGNWKTAIMQAAQDCNKENEWSFQFWGVKQKFLDMDWSPTNHIAAIIVPGKPALDNYGDRTGRVDSADVQHGIVIDPWRDEGNPWWKKVSNDTRFNWTEADDGETPNRCLEQDDIPEACDSSIQVDVEYYNEDPCEDEKAKLEVRATSREGIEFISVNGYQEEARENGGSWLGNRTTQEAVDMVLAGEQYEEKDTSVRYIVPECFNQKMLDNGPALTVNVFFHEDSKCPPVTISNRKWGQKTQLSGVSIGGYRWWRDF